MNAREDNVREAGGLGQDTGKCTRGNGRLPAGEATRIPALPHLPYGDAVHAGLAASGMAPDVMEAGVRTEQPGDGGELFLTVSWLTGHPDVDDPGGLDLLWSDLTGWSARAGGDVRVLALDDLAAPDVVADAALHLAADGLDGAWMPPDGPHRWEHAPAVEAALADWYDREAIR